MVPFMPCPLVFAMGLQNATVHRAGGVNIDLTYVTGTLVQVGRALADIARFKGGGRRVTEYMALWTSLALGAWALAISPLGALMAAAAIALCLAAITAITPTRDQRR
jgi:uncharacterized membrane protein YoaK (UPF0700 family)